MQLDQLILDVAFAARSKFPNTPFRVWYVMLNEKSWKVMIINTASKERLAEGSIKNTVEGALSSFKAKLDKIPAKTINSGS